MSCCREARIEDLQSRLVRAGHRDIASALKQIEAAPMVKCRCGAMHGKGTKVNPCFLCDEELHKRRDAEKTQRKQNRTPEQKLQDEWDGYSFKAKVKLKLDESNFEDPTEMYDQVKAFMLKYPKQVFSHQGPNGIDERNLHLFVVPIAEQQRLKSVIDDKPVGAEFLEELKYLLDRAKSDLESHAAATLVHLGKDYTRWIPFGEAICGYDQGDFVDDGPLGEADELTNASPKDLARVTCPDCKKIIKQKAIKPVPEAKLTGNRGK